ncbi:MAG: cytochrome C oxidase subunit IV family protein [Phycisphaerales bacterium JB058]
MSQAQAKKKPTVYNPADPHGFHEDDHHGHVIIPWQILLGVLLALLAFTALTVFQAQFEKFAAHEWGWQIPGWVNVVLAMGIATIKGTLVVMYFMQLRYDKGINIILLLFTLFAVWLFIMFTAIDLNNRGHITDWRAGEIIPGGSLSGLGQSGNSISQERLNEDFKGASNSPLYLVVKESYIDKHGLDAYEHELHAHHAGHGEHELSSADASRPRQGLTPGLFSTGVWKDLGDDHDAHGHHDDAHADEHDDHADEAHADDAEHADDNHYAGEH